MTEEVIMSFLKSPMNCMQSVKRQKDKETEQLFQIYNKQSYVLLVVLLCQVSLLALFLRRG